MNKLNWNLDQLKSHLNHRPEVKAWAIAEEHIHRRERYFMTEKSQIITDQDRNVHSSNISIKLFVKTSKEGRQGEITKKLFPSLPLDKQIDLAVDAAQQTDHQVWELPKEIPSNIPHVVTSDPNISEDINEAVKQISHQIETAVRKPRKSVFNSAELFLSAYHRELHLSNGLKHRSSQTRVYLEAAYSFAKTYPDGKIESDEFLNTQWAVDLNQLSVDKLFDETAEFAEKSLAVSKPETGKYSVIIKAEVLSCLLNEQLSRLSAINAYNGLPFCGPGKEFIPESHGDLLTITLDPTLEFGANTTAVSDQGIIQAPLKLVDQNRVISTATDKQYGDYLGQRPTTSRGNLVIDSGKLSYSELIKHTKQVVEILQFSGLFTDPNSGTFSSEIRLAKLYDNETGKVTYIKGGSLSGSISENFKNLRLSQSRVNHVHFSSGSSTGQGYFGPEFALLNDVSIVS